MSSFRAFQPLRWIGGVALLLVATVSAMAQTPLQHSPGAVGDIAQGETKTHPIEIDQADSITVILLYDGGNLNLALISPQGDVFDSTSAGGGWNEMPGAFGGIWETLIVGHPRGGTWTARVTAPLVVNPSGAAPYMLSVITETKIKLEGLSHVPDPIVGEPLRVRARLTNSGEPIPDANVAATVRRPDESTVELSCSDDGNAPDSARGDGVYTAMLKGGSTTMPGWYHVHVVATGHVGGAGQKFERHAMIDALIAKSHSVEDFDEVWEERPYGPDEPPIEIRVHLEHDSKSGAYSYVYVISNGSPFPLSSFHIGRKHASEEIRSVPLGWEDTRNVPHSSYAAPPRWDLLFGRDNNGRGSLMWSARDSSADVAPGQSMTEFRVRVSRPDATFERSHWIAFLRSGAAYTRGAYSGALMATKEPPPPGNSIDRLGALTITRSTTQRDVTISCSAPENAHPAFGILDSQGQLVQQLIEPQSKGPQHRVVWDGRNLGHRDLPPGEYFVLVKYGNTERYGRVILGR